MTLPSLPPVSRRTLLALSSATALAACASKPALLIEPGRGSGDLGLVIERESGSIAWLSAASAPPLVLASTAPCISCPIRSNVAPGAF